MEKDLDEVADGEKDSVHILNDFWNLFEPRVENAFSDMKDFIKSADRSGEELLFRTAQAINQPEYFFGSPSSSGGGKNNGIRVKY